MKSSKISPKIIISGGGTGGHIYPAIAIADEIKRRWPAADILFVGALGKMEMEKIPQVGYAIKGLPIAGINRSRPLSNLGFPMKLFKSLRMARQFIVDFQPDVVIGTGGFASGPVLWEAAKMNIPVVIQEQNSFPGITNKLLKNKAAVICVAYAGIDQFPKEKIQHTGNPIRSELFQNLADTKSAKEKLGFNPELPLILSIGGSQGSRTLNQAWEKALLDIQEADVQLLWQTGKLDFEKINQNLPKNIDGIHWVEFIDDMQTVFAAADVIVSRAGAMAISELCLVGKPVVLVPFPYATEDHQTKNAMALVHENAALMLTDEEVPEQLVKTILDLVKNESQQKTLAENIRKLGKPNATKEIVDILMQQIQ